MVSDAVEIKLPINKEKGKMKKNGMLKRARKSFLGRVICRLLGEEKGAVMMEYIIVGLLIAAAAIVAVGYLGNVMNAGFATLAHAVAAQPEKTQDTAKAGREMADALEGAATEHSNKMQENDNITLPQGGGN